MTAVRQNLGEALQPETVSTHKVPSRESGGKRSPTVVLLVASMVLLVVSAGLLASHLLSEKNSVTNKSEPQNAALAPMKEQDEVLPQSENRSANKEQEDDTQTRSWIFTKRFSSRINKVSANPAGDAPLSVRQTLTDALLGDLLQSTTYIENLDLSHCRKLSGSAFSQCRDGRNMHTLNLNYCSITHGGLQKLSVFPNLSTLEMAGLNLKDDDLEQLKSLPHLQYLNIADNSHLTDSSLRMLANLPSLKRVDVHHCVGISKGAIRAFKVKSHCVIDADTTNNTRASE